MALARAKLLELRTVLGAAARASEPWEDSYKQDRTTFRQLVAAEQAFQNSLAEYFHDFAVNRLSGFIDWAWMLPRLKADGVQPQDSQAVKDEMQLLVTVFIDHIEHVMTIGANAGEAIYATPADPINLQRVILQAAHEDTAKLVSQVMPTTRDLIRKSIQRSIDRGQTIQQTIDDLRTTIDNPVRAEMIARTESVNAYQSGQLKFAQQTGATQKTWEAKQVGACKICAPMNDVTVGIDELFTLPNGGEVLVPAAHVRCRCGVFYLYPNE